MLSNRKINLKFTYQSNIPPTIRNYSSCINEKTTLLPLYPQVRGIKLIHHLQELEHIDRYISHLAHSFILSLQSPDTKRTAYPADNITSPQSLVTITALAGITSIGNTMPLRLPQHPLPSSFASSNESFSLASIDQIFCWEISLPSKLQI